MVDSLTLSTVERKQFKSDVSPLGFLGTSKKMTPKKPLSETDLNSLKAKKAWEVAMGPAKSIPMNLIMGYMTGNSLQIIPISMTFMMLLNPLKAIFTETNRVFKGLEPQDQGTLLMLKFVFIICQLASMTIGIYKLFKMGLIPHSEADWLSWLHPVQFEDRVQVL